MSVREICHYTYVYPIQSLPRVRLTGVQQHGGHTEVGVDRDDPQTVPALNRVCRIVGASLLRRFRVDPVFQLPQAGEMIVVPATTCGR